MRVTITWLIIVFCWLKLITGNKLIDFLTTRGFLPANQTTGTSFKRSSSTNGILTSDPFMEATHFWPFDSSLIILTTDVITGRKAIMMHGARIRNSTGGKQVRFLSTETSGSYVICGVFKGTCYNDLTKCILGGMTVSFWMEIQSKDYRENSDQYILSSGAQSINSTGFAFVNFHGEYAALWNNHEREWDLRISRKEIPLDGFVNIVFVWDASSDSLSFYSNGIKQKSVHGEKAKRPNSKYTFLTIGRPNNADDKKYMMPLRMSYLALWDRPLTDEQVKIAYENVNEVLVDK